MADEVGVDRARWDAAHGAADAPTLRAARRATVWRALPEDVQPTTIWPSWPIDRLAAELELDRGETLLDVGCGRGDLSVALATRIGARLVGVDPSEVGRSAARQKASAAGLVDASFTDGHFLALGVDSASADAVLVADALQTAPDRGRALREIGRVLRPNRRLVIVGPTRLGDTWADLPAAGLTLEVCEETPDWHSTVASFATYLRTHEDSLRRELGTASADRLLATPFEEIQRSSWHGLVVARKNDAP